MEEIEEEILYRKYRPEKLEVRPDQILGGIYERPIRTAKQKIQFEEMVESVKSGGVHEDLALKRVKHKPNKFMVIFGWMRFQAVLKSGVPKFSATVYPADISDTDIYLMVLAENIIGVDMNPLDTAEIVFRLKQSSGWHNKTIAARFGKSEPWISKMLKLRRSVQLGEAVKGGEISKSQAEELSRISSEERQSEIIEKVKGATVAETKEIVEDMLDKEEKAVRIEELKRLIEEEKAKIVEAKKREDRKAILNKDIVLKERELKLAKSKISENILELTASIKEIESDYFGSIEAMNEAKANIDELNEELVAIDTEKLVKEKNSLEKRNTHLESKISILQNDLDKLKDELTRVTARVNEVNQQITLKEGVTNQLSYMNKQFKRAEEKKIRVMHKRRDDIENFEKVKAALGDEEKKHADKIHTLETELAKLKAGLKRFGGMPLRKREDKLKKLEEVLSALEGEGKEGEIEV